MHPCSWRAGVRQHSCVQGLALSAALQAGLGFDPKLGACRHSWLQGVAANGLALGVGLPTQVSS